MSRASINPGGAPNCGEPYAALGVDVGASDAEISKAYRRLALELHPDRQPKGLSKSEVDRVAKKFHNVTEARDFLLDPEHAEERRRYDAVARGKEARRAEDKRREMGMTERRRRMREELAEKEQRAGRGGCQSEERGDATDADFMGALRREGRRMRDKYREGKVGAVSQRLSRERLERKKVLERRQVRIKWSRTKVGTTHTEKSLAELLSRLGEVQEVELIGAKGNVALVTFVNHLSCHCCVKEYLENDMMRATYVGERRNEETLEVQGVVARSSTDAESMEERSHRQATERECILRQMEMQESGKQLGTSNKIPMDRGSSSIGKEKEAENFHYEKRDGPSGLQGADYPPKFPVHGKKNYEGQGGVPLHRLEEAEQKILGNILSPVTLSEIQAHIY